MAATRVWAAETTFPAVLVRLLVGEDRANVSGTGEFLDRGHRLRHVQIVIIGDRQLIGSSAPVAVRTECSASAA